MGLSVCPVSCWAPHTAASGAPLTPRTFFTPTLPKLLSSLFLDGLLKSLSMLLADLADTQEACHCGLSCVGSSLDTSHEMALCCHSLSLTNFVAETEGPDEKNMLVMCV